MEFIEDTELARLLASEVVDNAVTGEYMDPEGEQELEDNRLDVFEADQEFEHLDPHFLERPVEFEKQYRPVDVRPLEELRFQARKLDFYQHKVLEIGIKHARALVKARVKSNPLPMAPLVMVDGAAGSGKSCTINILREFIQLIMVQSGDNIECPYVLVCAPTGMFSLYVMQ